MKENSNLNYLKGLAIIIVMFTHIPNITKTIFSITKLGYIALNIFYAISGYLLIYSFITKKEYSRKFIAKKIKRIYIPYIISNIIYIIISFINQPQKIYPIKILFSILGLNIINGITFYINTILMTYILYYIIYTHIKSINITIPFTYIILTIFKIICATFKINILIFNDFSLSLLIGMYLGLFHKKIPIKNNYLKYPLIIVIVIFHFIYINFSNYSLWISQIIIPLLIPLLIIFNYNFRFLNKPLTFLGKISLELYLLHVPIFQLLRGRIIYIQNTLLYLTIYTIFLLLTAILLHRITNFDSKQYARM